MIHSPVSLCKLSWSNSFFSFLFSPFHFPEILIKTLQKVTPSLQPAPQQFVPECKKWGGGTSLVWEALAGFCVPLGRGWLLTWVILGFQRTTLTSWKEKLALNSLFWVRTFLLLRTRLNCCFLFQATRACWRGRCSCVWCFLSLIVGGAGFTWPLLIPELQNALGFWIGGDLKDQAVPAFQPLCPGQVH